MFELHENADISRDLKETKSLVENIKLVYGNQMKNVDSSSSSSSSKKSSDSANKSEERSSGGQREDPSVTMCNNVLEKVKCFH